MCVWSKAIYPVEKPMPLTLKQHYQFKAHCKCVNNLQIQINEFLSIICSVVETQLGVWELDLNK